MSHIRSDNINRSNINFLFSKIIFVKWIPKKKRKTLFKCGTLTFKIDLWLIYTYIITLKYILTCFDDVDGKHENYAVSVSTLSSEFNHHNIANSRTLNLKIFFPSLSSTYYESNYMQFMCINDIVNKKKSRTTRTWRMSTHMHLKFNFIFFSLIFHSLLKNIIFM